MSPTRRLQSLGRARLGTLMAAAALALGGCAAGSSYSGSTGSGGQTGAATGAGATTGAGDTTGTGGGSVGTLTGSGGSFCPTSACVPALGTHLSWAVEIDPLGSSAAAVTQIASVDLDASPINLVADAAVPISAAFTSVPGGALPASANAVLTFPPGIGGRPDLTYEASAAQGATADATAATLLVPAGALGRAGSLQLVPLPPSDQQIPPYQFDVTVAAQLAESVPPANLTLNGTLESAIGLPVTNTFVARAFAAGIQISSAPLTVNGVFSLAVPASSAGASVVVQLEPQNQGGPDPWWISGPIVVGARGNTLSPSLPAYSNPNVFGLTVVGSDGTMGPVSGALVRAQTTIPPTTAPDSASAGTTGFARSGTTNDKGLVSLSLLPGTATTTLNYALTVIPPAASPYATTCVPSVAVTVGGSAVGAANLPNVVLPLRPLLTGAVFGADGTPAVNVAVTATAGSAPTGTCASTPATSSGTVTNGLGAFSLPLDPGTYQIDYDPPAGAAVPRLTETGVVVSAGLGEIQHDVTLPQPAAVRGTVRGPDGSPLSQANVLFFEVRCAGQDDCVGPNRTAPWLRAETTTDANGGFLAVVPAPNTN